VPEKLFKNAYGAGKSDVYRWFPPITYRRVTLSVMMWALKEMLREEIGRRTGCEDYLPLHPLVVNVCFYPGPCQRPSHGHLQNHRHSAYPHHTSQSHQHYKAWQCSFSCWAKISMKNRRMLAVLSLPTCKWLTAPRTHLLHLSVFLVEFPPRVAK
jgi:hypothetical protein